MKIKILSKDLINKIAAGEVVERPASVVKELVENAIDAGSRQIIIEVKNGGIDLIQVTDDGSGMVREDAILSIKEHATSKLASQDDLFKIGTLGFRGEALSSISSVSDFTLVTKDEQSLSATKLILKNNVLEISQAGAPRGTCVTVENLFVNVPARRKFLKTPLTEFNAIADLFFNFCLSYPQIAWKLVNNDRVAYQFPASESFVRVADVL